jgi:hypothetical protein
MTLRKIAILALALLLPLSIGAQKKKKRVVKKPVVIEEPQEDPRITNMREMTQQILIIDSIVVDKDQILPHLRLSSETGSLMTTRDFLGKSVSGYAFINEMGNKAYFSLPDNSLRQQLFTSDVLGNEWSSPQPLTGISEGISEASYPFMLTDGITFYFAGKGEESIGGYDIFLTRYDSRSGSFFKPENIGMPFNSEANDYLYAIDEFNHIGYFVSDRRQPEGKVCIYIFVPSESRKTYDSSIYTEQQIRDFADIISIADTWGNGSERKAALARLKSINNVKPSADRKASAQSVTIVINDALTYSSAKDFRSSKAANLYQNLTKAQGRLSMVETDLTKARDLFATATAADRQNLRQRILQMEKEQQQLYQLIHSLEKDIRKEEIKVIN